MCPMTTTIMAETCSICAGSLKWTERTESQDPEVPGEKSSGTREKVHSRKKKTHSTQTTGKEHALKGQKLLAQGSALGNYGRKPVAL